MHTTDIASNSSAANRAGTYDGGSRLAASGRNLLALLFLLALGCSAPPRRLAVSSTAPNSSNSRWCGWATAYRGHAVPPYLGSDPCTDEVVSWTYGTWPAHYHSTSRIFIVNSPGQLDARSRSHLARMTSIAAASIDRSEAARYATCNCLSQLETLHIELTNSAAIEPMLTTDALPSLRELQLSWGEVDARYLHGLAGVHLRSLSLVFAKLAHESLAPFAQMRWLRELEVLRLDHMRLHSHRELSDRPYPRLRRLVLNATGLSDDDVVAVGRAALPALTELELLNESLSNESVRGFAQGAVLGKLRRLVLRPTAPLDDSTAALVISQGAQLLAVDLHLRGGPRTVDALAKHEQLQRVRLDSADLGDAEIASLLAGRRSQWIELSLQNNRVSLSGANAIAASGLLESGDFESLDLSGNPLGDKTAASPQNRAGHRCSLLKERVYSRFEFTNPRRSRQPKRR